MPTLWTESRARLPPDPMRSVRPMRSTRCLSGRSVCYRKSRGPIKPFARSATSVYTHSKRYYFACAQPDARRHDIDGNPIGPVSDEDRLAAQTTVLNLKGNPAPVETAATPIDAATLPKANLIHAGIFGRNRDLPSIS